MKNFFNLFWVLILSAQACFAESSDLQSALKQTHSEPNVLSIILSLLFVVFLIYITGILYTKLNIAGAKTVKKQMKDLDANNITILSTRQLGQNRNLHVVQIDNKKILIGSTPESINIIKELSAEQTEGEIEQEQNKITEENLEKSEAIKNEFLIKESKNNTEDSEEEIEIYKKYL